MYGAKEIAEDPGKGLIDVSGAAFKERKFGPLPLS
jgi:hypothetical protein